MILRTTSWVIIVKKKIKVRSRGLAVYIGMETQQEPEILVDGFVFESEKSVGEWDREYAGTRDSIVNQYLRSYGDDQRKLRNN